MSLSNAERQARWKAKRSAEIEALRKAAKSADPASEELVQARQEIDRLRAQLAAASKAAPEKPAADSKAAPPTDADRKLRGKWMQAQLEIECLRRQLADAQRAEPEQIAALRKRISDLETASACSAAAAKAAQTKAAKPPLDPESAAAREIKGLRRGSAISGAS
jgi:hypothetical protein